MKPRFYRRRYIINERFQYTFILAAILMCLLVLGVDLIFYQFFVNRAVELAVAQGVDPGAVNIVVGLIQGYLGKFMLISIVTPVLLMGMFGLFTSHRIAGPVFRTLAVINQLNKNERVPMPVRLRARDCFPELESALNHLVNHVQKDLPSGQA